MSDLCRACQERARRIETLRAELVQLELLIRDCGKVRTAPAATGGAS